jgi:hypothetical protein
MKFINNLYRIVFLPIILYYIAAAAADNIHFIIFKIIFLSLFFLILIFCRIKHNTCLKFEFHFISFKYWIYDALFECNLIY